MKFGILFLALLFFSFFGEKTVFAVPPPDFLLQVASQVWQIFALGTAFFSALFLGMYQAFRMHIILYKKWYFFFSFLGIVTFSWGIATWYDEKNREEKQAEYAKEWEAQKQEASPLFPQETSPPPQNTPSPSPSLPPNISPEIFPEENAGIAFLRHYYQLLSEGKIKEAYAISLQSVPFETFNGWYNNTDTTSLLVEDAKEQEDGTYLFFISLNEGSTQIHYRVLFDLQRDETGNIQKIERSLVTRLPDKILSSSLPIPSLIPSASPESPSVLPPLEITNVEFFRILQEGGSPFVLDAREDVEFEIGHFPKSTHIRFADLHNGEWESLPKDTPIYVFCWSGVRGKEVAEYLQSKGKWARYFEKGANGWVDFGGKWEGEIKFSKIYPDDRYRIIFTTEQVQESLRKGDIAVDVRSPEKFAAHHLPGSVNISLMQTPSLEISALFSSLPPQSQFFTVCDDYVNCFDAKLVGIELEKHGNTFVGRYNKPWDYR